MHEVQFMSRKAQFTKSLVSIHAVRQFIEFALQTHSNIWLNLCQQILFMSVFTNFYIYFSIDAYLFLRYHINQKEGVT